MKVQPAKHLHRELFKSFRNGANVSQGSLLVLDTVVGDGWYRLVVIGIVEEVGQSIDIPARGGGVPGVDS